MVVRDALNVGALVEHGRGVGAGSSADDDLREIIGCLQGGDGLAGGPPARQDGDSAVVSGASGLETLPDVDVAQFIGKACNRAAIAPAFLDIVPRQKDASIDLATDGTGDFTAHCAIAQVYHVLDPAQIAPSRGRAEVVDVRDIAAAADKTLAEDFEFVDFVRE